MRTILVVLAALVLGACNEVYSRTPLLPEAFQRGDPQLRSGLWQLSDGAAFNCPFDIRQRLDRWPDCAVGFEYQSGQFWMVSRSQRILAFTVRLAPGEPILVQEHWSLDALKDPRAPEPLNADNPFFGWSYNALTVVRTDAADRIIEAKMVEAQCGPLPAKADPPAADGKPLRAPVTDRPFPGLKIVGANCVAADLDTVRAALRQSASLGEPRTVRWIRDAP